jgi:uncharacterized protein
MNEIPAYPTLKQSFSAVGIVIAGMILFTPVVVVLSPITGKGTAMLVYYVLAIGIPYFIINEIRKKKTLSGGHNFYISDRRVLPFIAVVTLALIYGVVAPISSLIPMSDWFKKIVLEMSRENELPDFLMLVVAAPILEELIFRGIILDGLLKKYTPATAILLSSFLFGFVHLNPWQFVTAFVLGIFMGWVYNKTGSLSLTIFIHAIANLNAFVARSFIDINMQTLDESLIEMYGGTIPAILILCGSLALATAGISYLAAKFKFDNDQNQYPANEGGAGLSPHQPVDDVVISSEDPLPKISDSAGHQSGQ